MADEFEFEFGGSCGEGFGESGAFLGEDSANVESCGDGFDEEGLEGVAVFGERLVDLVAHGCLDAGRYLDEWWGRLGSRWLRRSGHEPWNLPFAAVWERIPALAGTC